MNKPKVSIITTTLNSEKTISKTILSIINQDYKNIEIIIVDGKSNDKTLEIINEFKGKISRIISEKDKGPYYAMNKGIRNVTGEIVGIINSDDQLANENIISEIVNEIQKKKVDAVYGNVKYINEKGQIIRKYISPSNAIKGFNKTIQPAHPSFFVKKIIYEKFGNFDTKYQIGSDYELLLRFLVKNKIPCSYIPKTLVYMNTGGLSNKNILNIIKNNMEVYKISKKYNLPINILTIIKKLIKKYNSKKKIQ